MKQEKIKIMEFGVIVDDKYIEFEDMSMEQLMYIGELEYELQFKTSDDYFYDEYFENDCWEEFLKNKGRN